MVSHAGWMAVFALFVSVIFSLLWRDEPREQVWFAGQLFIAFMATALVLGWLMYPFPP